MLTVPQKGFAQAGGGAAWAWGHRTASAGPIQVSTAVKIAFSGMRLPRSLRPQRGTLASLRVKPF